jgi:pyrroloquinoline quinone biosynthesis protein D
MTTINEATVLALSPTASFQSLGDSAVILMTDSGQLYTCNTTTEAFLKKVDGFRTMAEIIDGVLAEFEVDRDTLRGDMVNIASELAAEGIVIIAEAAGGDVD